jgi:Domain of unknown function (DUF222)/HNH endonuclease
MGAEVRTLRVRELPVQDSPVRSLAELEREITTGAVRLAAATAAWLELVAEFDRREGWAGVGVRSCAQWLAWQCGLTPGAAREHVRVARALGRLPLTTAAFAAGRLSYSKVRALTRVAEPAGEAELLELAGHLTASQLERVVRAWRRSDERDAQELADEAERVAAKRAFQWWWDADGMLTLQVTLDPEQGAALLAAVESRAERHARRDRALAKKAAAETQAFPRERLTARRCAALVELVEDGAPVGRRAGDPPRREVVVHVDAGVLADDAAAGRAHLEGGPSLRPAQVRRMLCEAALTVVVEQGGEPLALGRRRRLATAAQRRALLARDGGCARPGCAETRIERLHAHHLRRWAFGGPTDVSNMVLLCDADHGLVHDLDLTVARQGRELVVSTAAGQRVWGPADTAWHDGVGAAAGAPLTPVGSPPPASFSGTGERMSLTHVVWALLTHRDALRRRAA